jgi:hypothetical protein
LCFSSLSPSPASLAFSLPLNILSTFRYPFRFSLLSILPFLQFTLPPPATNAGITGSNNDGMP